MVDKILSRLRSKVVSQIKGRWFYTKLYKSYWHSRCQIEICNTQRINYLSAVPNPGAGIGHQIANWNAGFWFAKQFGLQFAHIPFSSAKWETFLGFGENEVHVEELIKIGYKKIRLPLFNELVDTEVALTAKIIKSYENEKVVFVMEQDQFYHDQFGVIADLKKKFFAAEARKSDQFVNSTDHFNIALHVRRGDIVTEDENLNANLKMRWQNNRYFEQVLKQVVENTQSIKPIFIYLFSQGERKDFPEFEKFNNLKFCLGMSAQDSFLHMIYADLLITSKSSFSYKPALLSNGIKVCPRDFWHGYPNTPDFVLADAEGHFETSQLTHLIPNK